VDGFSNRAGLGELLRRAGFHVQPLPLDRPPYDPNSDPSEDVDLIAFGSFASDSPKYQAYMAQYADKLDDFIDRAGLLFQFSQADQTELSPPFLPDTQDGSRSDTDFEKALILSKTHPLLAGVPTVDNGNAITYTLWENSASSHNKNTLWEVFQTFFGFEVILSGDPQARNPGLMEGAYGQGRFFVSALPVDKIINPATGLEDASPEMKAFNVPFFNNLYEYTKAVRDLATPPITITPQPGVSEVADGSWSIVLLPDTQIYSQNYPGVFEAQTSWIANNARVRNIRYVLHLGDIVNVNSVPEWRNAYRAMKRLDGVVPYALVPGNHDYGPGGNAATRDTFLNDYFHEEEYRIWPTFGGAMAPGKMDNTYHLFRAGGVDWIVMCLEWGPRDNTVAWADGILSQHPNRKAILLTHAYMNNNDYRYDITDTSRPQDYNPHRYSTPGPMNDGEQLWQKLVKKHNFVMTVNGHVLGDGTGYRVDNNDAGNPVHQMLSNYQFRSLGGEGYLRVLEFQPDGKTVKVSSYSPIYDKYLLTADQAFSFEVNLGAQDVDGDGVLDYYDANFDDDGDGLNNYQEFVTHGTDERRADTDGDGVSDSLELELGTDVRKNDRAIFDAFAEKRSDFGLFTRQDLVDARPNDVLVDVKEGNVRLKLHLEESTDLQQWTPTGDAADWTIPAPAGRRLYRFRIDAAE
jgi:3',5'-cyclic AMP phosphodiesterase CpdA